MEHSPFNQSEESDMNIARLIEPLVVGIIATILVIMAVVRLRRIRKERISWKIPEQDRFHRSQEK